MGMFQVGVTVANPEEPKATALENFGVDADPTERRLKPIPGIIGGFLASRGED